MYTLHLLLLPLVGLFAEPPTLLGLPDLEEMAKAPPGKRIAYGPEPLQYGELSLPEGAGPHPVVIFIHGGCWLSAYDMAHSRSLAQALRADGYAVWNLEYRRVGDPGGGWPGTFLDIARGSDHLRKLAEKHPLDLKRTVAMGHSAGGHLALWLAGRKKIPSGNELHTTNPLELAGVVALAPAPQLEQLHEAKVCGHVIDKLMGGSPTDKPERYRIAAPAHLAPLGVPQVVLLGKHDEHWSPIGSAYVEAARAAGETQLKLVEAPDAGHFEVIAPQSSTWPLVRDAIKQVLRKAD